MSLGFDNIFYIYSIVKLIQNIKMHFVLLFRIVTKAVLQAEYANGGSIHWIGPIFECMGEGALR